MNKVLMVEDDQSLGESLKERLEKEKIEIVWAKKYAEAINSFDKSFDLVILDVGLPDGNGFDLARVFKSQSNVPFIFMTSKNDARDRLEGYELGAEEYIPKPFLFKELEMRIRKVLDLKKPDEKIICGKKTISLESMTVTDENGEVSFLQSKDFQVLSLLIKSTPKVVSRDEILDKIWGKDQFPTPRTVDNTIVRLRKALDDKDGVIIRSVRGMGYQWILS